MTLRHNPRAGITGALYHDGRYFFQVLQGEAAAVHPLFERIRIDPRHRGVATVCDGRIAARSFARWSMRFVEGARLPALAAAFPAAALVAGDRDAIGTVESALAAV